MNFDTLKQMGTIYTLTPDGRLFDYNLSHDPKSLFDIGGQCFSNGWGYSWNYEDLNKTWADNKEILLLQNYDEFKTNHERFLEIKKVLNASLSPEQKINLLDAYTKGFYGSLYGEPIKDETIYIKPYEAKLWDGTALSYIWGWPGPDYSVYRIKDYGITWKLNNESEGEV